MLARLALLNEELWNPRAPVEQCPGVCVSERKLKPRATKRLVQSHRDQKGKARVPKAHPRESE